MAGGPRRNADLAGRPFVILIDTSAWGEFLRGTSSPVCEEVDRLLEAEIAITDPVLMEVLAGARDERHLQQLRGLLARARLIHVEPTDYPAASAVYRRCRRSGEYGPVQPGAMASLVR